MCEYHIYVNAVCSFVKTDIVIVVPMIGSCVPIQCAIFIVRVTIFLAHKIVVRFFFILMDTKDN